MAKKKFQSKATAKRFRSIGRALEASRGEIEAQTRRDVQALETAKGQAWEGRQATLGALGDITRSENANFQRLTNLEQKARTTRYDAIVKHGETVVQKFKDEAKQKQDYADYLKDLAPKRAKLVGELAEQGMQTVDTIRGVNQWTALKESGLLQQMTDGKADAHDSVVYSATGEVIKSTNEGDADGANYRQDTSIRLSSHWAQKKFLEWVKENKEALRNDIIQNYNKTAGEDQYGEWNAIRVQELGALGLLKKLGISDTTRNGTDIIEQFSAWGATDKQGFYETRKVGETQGRITDLTTTYKSVVANTPPLVLSPENYEAELKKYNKNVQVAFDNLSLAYKNGWFKAEYSGKVLNPNKGGGKYSNSADAVFEAIRTIIDNDPSIGPKEVNQRLGQLRTPDLKGDGKTTTIKERFPDRWQTDVEDYVVNKAKDREKARKNLQEANGAIFREKFQPFVDKRNEDGEFSNRELAFLFNKIESADITPAEKLKAYKQLGYNPSNYKAADNIRNIVKLLEAGDIEAAGIAYQSTAGTKKLSDEDKRFLQQKVTVFKEVDGIVGLDQFSKDLKGKLISREKSWGFGSTLTTSASATHAMLNGRILARYQDLRWTKDASGKVVESDVAPRDLWKKAVDEEMETWNKGVELVWRQDTNDYGPSDKDKGKYDPSNPYNYIRTRGKGEATKGTIYPSQASADALNGIEVESVASSKGLPEDVNQTIAREERLESDSEQQAIADARNDFYKGKPTIPIKAESIDKLDEWGLFNEDDALNSKRLIGTEDATKVYDVLKYNRDVAPFDFSYKEIPYPPQIEALKNTSLGSKYTRGELLNRALFNLYGPGTPVVPLDNDSCTAIKNSNKPYKAYNERSEAAYASCKAQNITPTSFAVKWFQETGDARQAFRLGMQVPEEWTPSQQIQAWIKDGGPVLEPGFDWGVAEEAFIVPPKPILDRILGNPGPRTLPKRSRE